MKTQLTSTSSSHYVLIIRFRSAPSLPYNCVTSGTRIITGSVVDQRSDRHLQISTITYAVWIYSQVMVFPPLHHNNPITDITIPPPVYPAHLPAGLGTVNATMLVLCRESDLDGILSSMHHVEKRFNDKYGYPWTFLNEVEFSDDFKQYVLSSSINKPSNQLFTEKSKLPQIPMLRLVVYRKSIGINLTG
jgi:hypothetical protein